MRGTSNENTIFVVVMIIPIDSTKIDFKLMGFWWNTMTADNIHVIPHLIIAFCLGSLPLIKITNGE